MAGDQRMIIEVEVDDQGEIGVRAYPDREVFHEPEPVQLSWFYPHPDQPKFEARLVNKDWKYKLSVLIEFVNACLPDVTNNRIVVLTFGVFDYTKSLNTFDYVPRTKKTSGKINRARFEKYWMCCVNEYNMRERMTLVIRLTHRDDQHERLYFHVDHYSGSDNYYPSSPSMEI